MMKTVVTDNNGGHFDPEKKNFLVLCNAETLLFRKAPVQYRNSVSKIIYFFVYFSTTITLPKENE